AVRATDPAGRAGTASCARAPDRGCEAQNTARVVSIARRRFPTSRTAASTASFTQRSRQPSGTGRRVFDQCRRASAEHTSFAASRKRAFNVCTSFDFARSRSLVFTVFDSAESPTRSAAFADSESSDIAAAAARETTHLCETVIEASSCWGESVRETLHAISSYMPRALQ